mgnify:CR=1 FL=1
MGSCTNEGVTVKSRNKGVNIRTGTKAADTPRRIVYGRAKVGGVWVYAETSGAYNQYLHLIMLLCDGPIQEIETVYFGSEAVTLDGSGNGTGKWSGVVSITKHLGETDQDADAALVSASAGKWTTNHKLSGIAYLYIKLTNWDATSSSAVPAPVVFGAVPDVSAVVKGRSDIYDPRSELTGYSDNPALCLSHFRDLRSASALNEDAVIVAAQACDITVGSRKLYTVGGVIEATASVEDVTRQFLTAMGGTIAANAAGHFLRVGHATDPTLNLTWDHVRSEDVELKRTTGTNDTFAASYASEANGWETTDADGTTDAAKTLKLDLVSDDEQAQQVEAIANKQAGPTDILTFTASAEALDLTAGDAVDIYLEPLASGRFEVIETEIEVGATIEVKLTLEKQRASLFDIVTTTPATAQTLTVSARILAVTTMLPAFGGYGAGSWPIQATVTTAEAGTTIRYSLSAMPSLITDGSQYYGVVSLADPGLGNSVTLYATAFKDGWVKSQNSITYTRV